ncbi:MAG: UDP-N-acetylglucosamine--LPS N-acetylglucosamine transferase [Conexibacter sp.]|nr:UDP-N-acetylglucosamine--LPS N-acetylglucosamine transferase [Conexibacter sp.]
MRRHARAGDGAAPEVRAHARRRNGGTQAPVLLVCSSGGHLLQLVQMSAAWEDRPRLWITFDKSDARVLLAGERVAHAFGPTNRSIKNFLRNLRFAVTILRRERPAAMITTGAGVAVPFAWLGRIMGVRVFYVESVTRIEQMSLSGRLIRPVADQVFVQWPELAATSPRLSFAGNLFAD